MIAVVKVFKGKGKRGGKQGGLFKKQMEGRRRNGKKRKEKEESAEEAMK